MKNCPNCNSDVEPGFQVCWNCNYSFTENKVLVFEEETSDSRKINCLRCHVPMRFSGEYKFHEGPKIGIWGNIFEAFVNRESFDIYLCPKCGKVEFFSSRKN